MLSLTPLKYIYIFIACGELFNICFFTMPIIKIYVFTFYSAFYFQNYFIYSYGIQLELTECDNMNYC